MAVITDVTDLMDIHPRTRKKSACAWPSWPGQDLWRDGAGLLRPALQIDGRGGWKDPHLLRFGGERAHDGDGPVLKWFEIAGADHIFYKAAAEIDGSTVVIRSPGWPRPGGSASAWHQMAVPNLFNKKGCRPRRSAPTAGKGGQRTSGQPGQQDRLRPPAGWPPRPCRPVSAVVCQ